MPDSHNLIKKIKKFIQIQLSWYNIASLKSIFLKKILLYKISLKYIKRQDREIGYKEYFSLNFNEIVTLKYGSFIIGLSVQQVESRFIIIRATFFLQIPAYFPKANPILNIPDVPSFCQYKDRNVCTYSNFLSQLHLEQFLCFETFKRNGTLGTKSC